MKGKTQSGQSIVEFALVLPLLVLFLMAILESGLLLYDKAVITNAAREGARAGIVAVENRTFAGVQATAINAANLYLTNNLVTFQPNTPSITVTPTGSAPYTMYNTLTVRITYNYGWLALPNFLSVIDPVPLGSESTMHFE